MESVMKSNELIPSLCRYLDAQAFEARQEAYMGWVLIGMVIVAALAGLAVGIISHYKKEAP